MRSILNYNHCMKTQLSRHFDNNNETYLAFKHFIDYCQTIYDDIQNIEKYYSKEFNQNSTQTISTYKRLFELYVKAFYYTCYDENKCQNKEIIDKLSFENQIEHYFQNLSMLVSNRLDFYIGNKIAPKYYSKIENISNKIFKLEDDIAEVTNTFWKDILAKSVDNIQTGKFSCLAKVLIDWREDNATKELSEYMNSRYALSVSYITDYKSRFFGEINKKDCLVGILYCTDKILAGYHRDAYLEEFIDGKCPLKHYETYTNIQRTNKFGKHEIFSKASKIATPRSVLFRENERFTSLYNEVIIDKRDAKPFAVFCIRNINGIQAENYQKAKVLAKQIANKFKLPLVELDSKNEFNYQDENSLDIEKI